MRSVRTLVALAAFLAGLASILACGAGQAVDPMPSPSSRPPAETTHMSVDAAAVRRTVDAALVLGGNLGVWVPPAMLASPTDRFVRERGAGLLRFPGGSMAGRFCWKTMRVLNDSGAWERWSWGTTVDDYIAFLRATGSRPLYGLNPFDHAIEGDLHSAAEEAEGLAAHLVAAGFAGAYYEVGNEHEWCCPALTPAEYVAYFVTIAQAVKRADPSARLMGPVTSSPNAEWRDAFIGGLAQRGQLGLLHTFSFHYYGGWLASWNSDGIDLTRPQVLGAEIAAVRAKLAQAGAGQVGVAVTEYNAAIWNDVTRGAYSLEQALWLADAAGELFDNADLANVWVDLSNEQPHSLLFATTTPVTRSTNYWPFVLVADTLGFGRRDAAVAALATTADRPASRVTLHAARGSDGRLGMLFVNKGEPLRAELRLSNRACSAATALLLDATTQAAGAGPTPTTASCTAGALTVDLPRLSAVGVVLE
jgi:hypothetical protein